MSRSIVGGKPVGWEYWGKRKGSYWVDRKTSHKMERMQLKEEDREIVKDALSSSFSCILSILCDVLRSTHQLPFLFPQYSQPVGLPPTIDRLISTS